MERQLNIGRLVESVGGAAQAARIAGTVRTAPYGWIKRNYISSVVLAKILSAHPNLNIDDYFETNLTGETNGGDKTRCGDGISGEGMVDHPDQARN